MTKHSATTIRTKSLERDLVESPESQWGLVADVDEIYRRGRSTRRSQGSRHEKLAHRLCGQLPQDFCETILYLARRYMRNRRG